MLTYNGIEEWFYQEVIEEGGGFKLSWEELNTQDHRENTIYTQEHVDLLISSINEVLPSYLLEEGDEELLEIEIANCGLCIDVPPISTQGWVVIDGILKSVLTLEDYQSISWHLCWSNGYTAD
jgi:hypothetical protein